MFLGEHSMMANHVTGDAPWELFAEGATAAGWVILPVGSVTCLTDEGQRKHLPEGLDNEVVLVRSGSDLREVLDVV